LKSQIEGFVLTPQGFMRGHLEHRGGRITDIVGVLVSESELRHEESALPLLLPGFVDDPAWLAFMFC
jgi:N-acetylglucosamine-6-phosphate deacetylase